MRGKVKLRPSVVRFTLTAASVAETKVASSLRPSVAVHSRECNGLMPAIKSAATPREIVFMLGGEFDQKGREGTSGKRFGRGIVDVGVEIRLFRVVWDSVLGVL